MMDNGCRCFPLVSSLSYPKGEWRNRIYLMTSRSSYTWLKRCVASRPLHASFPQTRLRENTAGQRAVALIALESEANGITYCSFFVRLSLSWNMCRIFLIASKAAGILFKQLTHTPFQVHACSVCLLRNACCQVYTLPVRNS